MSYSLDFTSAPSRPEFVEFNFSELGDLPPFDTENVHHSVKNAHACTRKWVKAILDKESAYWLTLFGVPGCGKTMLARLARHTLRNRGEAVQLWNWPRVWRMCLDGDWGVLDHLIELPILILDDVGAEFTGTRKTAELNTARLYEIAEARLGKWTFITSNLDTGSMERDLGARFVSRIFRGNSEVIDLTKAADYSFLLWKTRQNQQTTYNEQN